MQGIKVNVLDGRLHLFAIAGVLPGASFGLANVQPVGGFIAGAGETIPLDKGFEQINGVSVFGLPIATQAPGYAAQNVAGQVRHFYPRKY